MDLAPGRLAEACPPRRQQLASRAQLLAVGLGTAQIAELVSSGGLLRLQRGSYALTPLPVRGKHLLSDGAVDPGFLAEVRSVLLAVRGAAADVRTAAVLWRMDMLVEPGKPEVRVPRSSTRVALEGVRVRCSDVGSAQLLGVEGLEPLAVLTAVDTVLACCLDRPLQEAVVIADSALRRGLVTLDELAGAVAERRGTRGGPRLRRMLGLVDPSSGSVLESLLRYLLNTHGLWPTSQITIRTRDGKRVVGRVDFALGNVVIECDGRRWHDPADARNRDRERDNGLARNGWLVLRFTWDEVRRSPAYVLASVREALLPHAA